MLLIFDEVVTGFRVVAGRGAGGVRRAARPVQLRQDRGRRSAGGGGGGRKDILDQLDFAVSRQHGTREDAHPGTFNANPVSAAAGTAALTAIAETDACERASRTAASLRAALNEVLAEEGVPWAVYGTYSGFHTFLNPRGAKSAASVRSGGS